MYVADVHNDTAEVFINKQQLELFRHEHVDWFSLHFSECVAGSREGIELYIDLSNIQVLQVIHVLRDDGFGDLLSLSSFVPHKCLSLSTDMKKEYACQSVSVTSKVYVFSVPHSRVLIRFIHVYILRSGSLVRFSLIDSHNCHVDKMCPGKLKSTPTNLFRINILKHNVVLIRLRTVCSTSNKYSGSLGSN